MILKIEVSDDLSSYTNIIVSLCNEWKHDNELVEFNQTNILLMIHYVNTKLNDRSLPLIKSHSIGCIFDCYGQYDLITLKG